MLCGVRVFHFDIYMCVFACFWPLKSNDLLHWRSRCTQGITNMLVMSFCSLCLLWLQPGCVAISRGPGWCCSEIMMLQPPFQTGLKRRELRVLRKGPVYSRFRSNERHDAVYFSAPGGMPRRPKSLQRVTQPVKMKQCDPKGWVSSSSALLPISQVIACFWGVWAAFPGGAHTGRRKKRRGPEQMASAPDMGADGMWPLHTLPPITERGFSLNFYLSAAEAIALRNSIKGSPASSNMSQKGMFKYGLHI